MPAHRAHPITDPDTLARFGLPRDKPDPEDAVLFDRCERCAEHAQRPTAMSHSHLSALWLRMVAVNYRGEDRGGHRTVAEAHACNRLYEVAVFLERWTSVDPWRWPLDRHATDRLDVAGQL